ncbi:MAG: hypothetical protein BGN89_19820 [Alphaproteobacteria bacterium 64-6]|jgi:hypothetical protein|uniref:hypothetical protein n=1 Tax=Hyphomicrobium sp. CS1BSMeth3 TaxID=1892844 RepID=UPI000930D6CB|nr:hypothetical protein [Hyphomicrobium sp. CS1BSMeth3]MBN9259266.1 hypothetical protein [Hyphomicrobium sp.]OJU27083.1 MAG: hypothetical protein BGN89_19820 [Alphaproteobacteria bacterium 64-6]
MRPFPGPLAFALGLLSSALLGSFLFLAAPLVHATDKAPPKTPDAATCTCPETENAKPWPRPKFADAMPADAFPRLDTGDEVATLEALHLALSELGDGSSYVWHRRNGRLSGIISPTVSFKDAEGRVCRHITMSLSAGKHSARTEGIACRMADRSWRLEG